MQVNAVNAGIYCRISYVRRTDGTVDTLGVERQEPPCRDLVERIGGTVVDRYTDNDTSAWSGKRRPEYERMLADLRTGRINALVAWQADRLIRRVRDAGELLDVVQAHGAQLFTVTGIYDLATAAGRFNFRNMANMAEMESDLKSERLILKHAQLAESGAPKGGGVRPFGFQRNGIDHHPEEAELLRDAAKRVLAGESMHSVLTEWERRGIRSPAGKVISSTSLRRALLAPRTFGQRQYRGAVVGPATWKPILDLKQQEDLKALFTGRPRQATGAPKQYLLSGIAACGRCDRPLVHDIVMRKRRYGCRKDPGHRGCGRIWTIADPLDEFITALVLDRLAGPGLAKMLAALAGDDPDHAALAAQIAADEVELAELEKDRYTRRDSSGRPLVSPQNYPALRDELQARIDSARRRQRPRPEARVLTDLAKLGGTLRWAWKHDPEFTLERKRSIIRACLPELTILPGRPGRRPFDTGRVRYRWVDQRPE